MASPPENSPVTLPSTSPSPRRINVRGTSGAGKTRFAQELASRLDLPCIELAALHWGPNWSEPSPEAFRATIEDVIAAHPRGWVIDGGYDRKLGELVTGAADTIVWIDLPLTVVLFRLLRRICRHDHVDPASFGQLEPVAAEGTRQRG